ncbi:uncharacterized protein LOC129578016 [Sitodiplosis mosellana]|uniref:uncharacterized protein LOC129578016 n=1 Tax=Sitodiplosis mosellana TaxID=263140 RepID=UPI002444EAB2|nr:uncharacterized protein LOC129578016 [Sitodiplosis mosellana]
MRDAGDLHLFIDSVALFIWILTVNVMTIVRISRIFSEFFSFLSFYFYLFVESVKLFLFLSTPILCAYSYYELWHEYTNGELSPRILPYVPPGVTYSYILLNIVTTCVHYFRTFDANLFWYWHFWNFLLCESCAYLSILKFLMTKPFELDEERDIFDLMQTILCLLSIIAYMTMNSLNHLMMTYCAYRDTREQHPSFSCKLRSFHLFFCAIVFLSSHLLAMIKSYPETICMFQLLFCFQVFCEMSYFEWGQEACIENGIKKFFTRPEMSKIWFFSYSSSVMVLLLRIFLISVKEHFEGRDGQYKGTPYNPIYSVFTGTVWLFSIARSKTIKERMEFFYDQSELYVTDNRMRNACVFYAKVFTHLDLK